MFACVCIILVNMVMKNEELKKLELIVSSYILKIMVLSSNNGKSLTYFEMIV